MRFRASIVRIAAAVGLGLAASTGTALAHVRPETTNPQAGARLDTSPAHLVLNYDGNVVPSGTSVVVLDGTGDQVPIAPDPESSTRMSSVSPATDLAPGPYTVDWTTTDAQDGHVAQGFYTFVVNGGPVGVLFGQAQAQTSAADLQATLTVSPGPDGASTLRVGLDKTDGVERVRIRLSRPDLGEDLLDTHPSDDGGWILDNNEIALPGTWHAVAIVRRTNIFDDVEAPFDFTVDAATGQPVFASGPGAVDF